MGGREGVCGHEHEWSGSHLVSGREARDLEQARVLGEGEAGAEGHRGKTAADNFITLSDRG